MSSKDFYTVWGCFTIQTFFHRIARHKHKQNDESNGLFWEEKSELWHINSQLQEKYAVYYDCSKNYKTSWRGNENVFYNS